MVCAVEEIEKSTLFWGEGGKCDQDAQKCNFITKCLNTFVAHCSFIYLFCVVGYAYFLKIDHIIGIGLRVAVNGCSYVREYHWKNSKSNLQWKRFPALVSVASWFESDTHNTKTGKSPFCNNVVFFLWTVTNNQKTFKTYFLKIPALAAFAMDSAVISASWTLLGTSAHVQQVLLFFPMERTVTMVSVSNVFQSDVFFRTTFNVRYRQGGWVV